MISKELFSICKDQLFVSTKDDIAKRYLSTICKKYQNVLNYMDKKEFNSSLLINDDLIQEFTLGETTAINCNNKCLLFEVKFSNICIGSTHIRYVHDFDNKVISKLAMLEFLCNTNMGTLLYKDIKNVEIVSEFKKLDWNVTLKNDKAFSGCEIKIPFIVAIIIDVIRQTALTTEDIFRKSTKFTVLMDFYKNLHMLMNSEINHIKEIHQIIQNLDPILLCTTLKMLLQNFNPLFPMNVLKFIYSLPDMKKNPQTIILLYQCLMLQISETERNILEVVLELLSNVVDNQINNNMCLQSIATLFAPVLFNPDQESVNMAINVLIQMIHYKDIIFLIPRNVIKIYRADNIANPIIFEPKKTIGKKSQLEISNKSVILSCYKKTPGNFIHGSQIKKTDGDDNNNFVFKFKRKVICLNFNEYTTTSDVVNMALKESSDSNINPSEFRLFENHGNIYQSCLHPGMLLINIIQDNNSAKFVVDSFPEFDLVKSTLKSLSLYLNNDTI